MEGCLRFTFTYIDDTREIYKIEWGTKPKLPPLLPLIPWAEKFGSGMLSNQTINKQNYQTSYRRHVAGIRRKKHTQILRVGNHLIDTLFEQLLSVCT